MPEIVWSKHGSKKKKGEPESHESATIKLLKWTEERGVNVALTKSQESGFTAGLGVTKKRKGGQKDKAKFGSLPGKKSGRHIKLPRNKY